MLMRNADVIRGKYCYKIKSRLILLVLEQKALPIEIVVSVQTIPATRIRLGLTNVNSTVVAVAG